ncbi:hypothetical protein [Hydrogenimonas urashimensis]|uniref:hypothetical protein n=1 Tax=Hydrogenimonas urashimensis TaxID=2740515 RepID=UPI001915A189|nr:hypothetical protein [Hydrogenimonas urashimensis]
MWRIRKTAAAWALGLAVLLSCGTAAAAQKGAMGAEELLQMAVKKAHATDPSAYLVRVAYDGGTRDLTFAGGSFTFFSPKKEAAHEESKCYRLDFANGRYLGMRESSYSRIRIEGVALTPEKAIEAAMRHEMGPWWRAHPRVKLRANLAPAEYMHRAPGFGDRSRKGVFVWELRLDGPGLAEQLACYVEAKQEEFLGCKKIPVPRQYRHITPQEAQKELERIMKSHPAGDQTRR